MSTVKFCINCKHFQETTTKCIRIEKISLVTGKPEPKNISAELERSLTHTGCGEQAKYYEPIRNTANITTEFDHVE